MYSTQTELSYQRFPFWWKCSQCLSNQFISKEAISIASNVPGFLHMKMTTSPVFPIDISPSVAKKYLAPHPPPQAILMKTVLKRQTFWVILFMGKIMAFLWDCFEFCSFVILKNCWNIFYIDFHEKKSLTDRNYECKCWEWIMIN